jgi:ABC-type lipoprotein export system ATPase subunit
VTLRIRRGEWVTILGKSGGGKTSLLNIIGTIDKPTKGEITICSKRMLTLYQHESNASMHDVEYWVLQ